jgi:hypothetical protein
MVRCRVLRPPRAALLCAVALVLAPPPGASAGGPDAWRIAAGPYIRKPGGEVAAPLSRHAVAGLRLAVEYLEPAARASFVASLDGGGDPFAVPPGRPELYHAFRVSFDNRSGEAVRFQPGNVVLVFDKGKNQQFPVDLTDFYRTAARAGGEVDPDAMMARAARLIFEGSTTIPRGARADRLLVFGPLPPKWKEMRVHFSFLQIGTETHTVSFLFHRQPVKG